MRKNADTELTSEIPPTVANGNGGAVQQTREPDFKIAFEVAANQRDKANQNLCNMQIELAMIMSENEELKQENADLKKKLGSRE